MKSRIQSIITQSFLLCLSLAFMSAAHAQKVAVTEADPNVAEQDTLNLDVKIKGRGFRTGSAVTFWITGSTTNNGGVTVNSAVVHDSKNLTANIDVPLGATISDYDIEVAVSSSRRGRGTTLFSVKQKGGGSDTTPPAPIDDFGVRDPVLSTSATLVWTSPGDDGDSGSVDRYVLRQAVQTDSTACDGSGPYDFGNAQTLDPPPTSPANWLYEFPVEGLTPETCYAFELEAFDEVPLGSGRAFAVALTKAAPLAGAWNMEVLPGETYIKLLELDPATTQPVIFAADSSTYFLQRSADGTWTTQSVKNNGSGEPSFAYDPVGLNFGGVLRSHRNVPSYAERQPDGSWDVIQITREKIRANSLAYDESGTVLVAFRTQGDRYLRLARYNGSSFDIETPELPDGSPLSSGDWGVILKFHPVTKQPNIFYTSEDDQKIILASYDGSAWSTESIHLGQDIGADVQVFSVEYDPNNQPVIIFRHAIDTFWNFWMRMIRPDSSGNWDPAKAMTIDPQGPINQHIADLAIADDGTLYVSMSNQATQIRVGRFCEANQNFGCTPTIDPLTGQNGWLWDIVVETVGGGSGSTSIVIDKFNNTIAIVADEYYSCDPGSTSVICGSGN